MNFASYDFWKILIVCFVGSRLVLAAVRVSLPVAENTIAKIFLLASALILLSSESSLTLVMFLWVVILGWFCLLLQQRRWPIRLKYLLFLVLLVAQLTPLFYYKYWNFVFNEILGLTFKSPSVIIPMGLSFYTFQTIGFWIDNLRNPQPRPSFLDYLNFSSFFPQIVAGPIEKRDSLLPQIETVRFKIHRANLEAALQWIILGLAYKLIVADNLGNLSEKFCVSPSNAWQVWLECLFFGFRIYFDFAGYSFIAVGLGLLLGVHLTLNFRCPYWSSDLRTFWRNWHVTLGAWLRDYIYLPIGGRKSHRWMFNVVIVFFVSGIWHGAGWGFIIWGIMHGLGVVFCGIGNPWTRLGPLRWVATFAYTTAAWLFFLERDPALLFEKARSLVMPAAYAPGRMAELPSVFANPSDAVMVGFIMIFAFAALALEGIGTFHRKEPYQISRHPAACIVMVFMTVLLAPMEESKFIYFNF